MTAAEMIVQADRLTFDELVAAAREVLLQGPRRATRTSVREIAGLAFLAAEAAPLIRAAVDLAALDDAGADRDRLIDALARVKEAAAPSRAAEPS